MTLSQGLTTMSKTVPTVLPFWAFQSVTVPLKKIAQEITLLGRRPPLN